MSGAGILNLECISQPQTELKKNCIPELQSEKPSQKTCYLLQNNSKKAIYQIFAEYKVYQLADVVDCFAAHSEVQPSDFYHSEQHMKYHLHQ